MKFDDVLKIIGDFGKYQKIQFVLICLVAVVSAFLALNMVFVGGTPYHHCAIPASVREAYFNTTENATDEGLVAMYIPLDKKGDYEECKMYATNVSYSFATAAPGIILNGTAEGRETQECPEGWYYSHDPFGKTIVSEWDLVCDSRWMRDTAKSIFFAGRLVGAVVFGQLSDKFGRKPVFMACLVLQIIAGIAAAFSPNMPFFYVVYFLQGVMQVGVFLTVYVMGTELVGPSHRKFTAFCVQGAYSIGYMILPGLAYFIRSWKWLEIAISLPAIFFLSYYWFVPESVRWLLSNKKMDQAAVIIKKAAKVNNVSLDEATLTQLEAPKKEVEKSAVVEKSCLYLVSTLKMAAISFNVWFNWVVNALVYYGLALNTSEIGGNVYINFFLAGAVEIPAYIICVFLLDRLGRRRLICGLMVIGGITCGIVPFIPSSPEKGAVNWAAITLASIGKLCITASYGIIYLFAAEVFPTCVRNVGMGIASMSARIGGILAPFVLLIGEYSAPVPLILFGVLSIIGGLTSLLLPETLGRPLPETVEDVHAMVTAQFSKRKAVRSDSLEMNNPMS
ncbi:organic cation transporter protein-like isoform X2 [Lineus longissimus]|uniref:organic cation transporter protein-like isoform X2 n=1 Tax=Lineus longissimus TaxID=88925 RepID=UPI00315C5810